MLSVLSALFAFVSSIMWYLQLLHVMYSYSYGIVRKNSQTSLHTNQSDLRVWWEVCNCSVSTERKSDNKPLKGFIISRFTWIHSHIRWR